MTYGILRKYFKVFKDKILEQSDEKNNEGLKGIFSKSEELLFDATKPIVQFVLMGLFGGMGKKRSAFLGLEKKLTIFYQNLYDFDPNEMAQDIPALQEHLKKQMQMLFAE